MKNTSIMVDACIWIHTTKEARRHSWEWFEVKPADDKYMPASLLEYLIEINCSSDWLFLLEGIPVETPRYVFLIFEWEDAFPDNEGWFLSGAIDRPYHPKNDQPLELTAKQ